MCMSCGGSKSSAKKSTVMPKKAAKTNNYPRVSGTGSVSSFGKPKITFSGRK